MFTFYQSLGLASICIWIFACLWLSRDAPLGWIFVVYGLLALLGLIGLNFVIGYIWPPACSLRESVFLDSLLGCGSPIASAGWGLLVGGLISILRAKLQ